MLTGVLIAAEDDGRAHGRHRLVPARGARPAATVRCLAAGQKVLVRSRASPSCSASCRPPSSSTVRLGDARRHVRVRSHRGLTTRLIEGEYPELPQPRAGDVPDNVLTVGTEALLEALRRVKIMAQRDTSSAVRLRHRRRHAELVGDRDQDVGNAHEELDANYEGTEMTVGFNPDYLLDGVDAIDADEVTLRARRPGQAGGAARRRPRRLPLPADAACASP